MESPVMTSASSHRLRSAVSACAQPTHSYLSSSYLSSSIQVESQDRGDSFKKFNKSGKSNDNSILNITRKPRSSNDFSLVRKRRKINNEHGLDHQRLKKNAKEVENSSNEDVFSLIPKQLLLGNDFFSKLKFRGNLLESKRLVDYLDKAPRNENVTNNCEKVIDRKTNCKNTKKNGNYNYNSNNCNKVLNYRYNKSKKSTNSGKKDSINDKSEKSEKECTKCGFVHLEVGIKDERQEITKWQPKHVVTRRTAQLVREIRNVWQSREGSTKSVPPEYVRLLFNDLQLFPSVSKVNEMLEYAKECPGTPSVAFGEFRCISKDSSKCEKSYQIARPSPVSRISDKNVEKRGRKFSKGMSKYEVFLGGSCNPTTWRTDFAIPELEKMGISYYNPILTGHSELCQLTLPSNKSCPCPRVSYLVQLSYWDCPSLLILLSLHLFEDCFKFDAIYQVEEWKPELMEVEYHAKENATVMFFVLDNQTRGVSALIEVAHLAGNRRELILVIQSYTQINSIICDEEISKEEYEDLKRGQEVLQVLVERQGIPVFNNIQVALECTEKILRENLRIQDLQTPVHTNRKTLISPRDVFEKLDSGNSGEISVDDACLALYVLTEAQVSKSDFKNLLSKAGKDLNGTLLGDIKFDYEHFSGLVTQFKKQLHERIPLDSSFLSNFCYKDVYLGGTIENTSWRESIAIPALEEEKLSYFVPRVSEEGKRFTEIEAATMDSSFVLLFVITNTARSIAAMAIAGHYIGKGANVILCVQNFPENAIIGKEKLSENAVKDYNRGRMYLMDIAERSGVPVREDISTAVKFVIQKCRNR